jgi:hypothetical protein
MRLTKLRPAAALASIAAAVSLLAVVGRGEAPPATAARGPTSSAAATSDRAERVDPIAARLCHALHGLPAARRAECCGRAGANLAGLCAAELSASLRRGAVAIDGAGVEQCTADATRELAGCDWVSPRPPKPPDSCTRTIAGQRDRGSACHSSLECRDGLHCRGAQPERPGICVAPSPPHARCEVPADNLAAFTGLRGDPRHRECDGLCLKGQCLPLAEAGAPCSSSAACAPGLHCIAGRCEARGFPQIGEPCAENTPCETGAYCSSGRCAAVKQAGEPCSVPSECRGLACEKRPGAAVGTCAGRCGASVPPSGSAPG